MTTLLLRTRHDGPREASPRVATPLAPAALAPARESAELPGGPQQTVTDLIAYYTAEVLPTLAKNTQYQRDRFLMMMDRQYGHLPLTAMTPAWLRSWRDQLGRRLKPDSVRQYMDTFSAVLTVGVNELAWLPEHPMRGRQVRKPPASRGRVRFPQPRGTGAALAGLPRQP